jgi:hypothetical protein
VKTLAQLARCFQGVIPSLISTCSKDGVPNVTYVSQVHYIDSKHVALSCQFFNKTRQNVAENPYATIQMYDPVNFDAYHLKIRFKHSEYTGPLFDMMALRIQAIASHSGMTGVFRLLSADIYEIVSFEAVPDFKLPEEPDAPPSIVSPGPMGEIRGLQMVSVRINQSRDLDELLRSTLLSLDEGLGFTHSIVLLPDESGERLFSVASRGYGASGVGAEVRLGEGLIGTVARERKMIRLSGVHSALRYGRAVRERAEELGMTEARHEVPLPGLPDAQAQLVLPLVIEDRLIGVLALESTHAVRFEEWHEAFIQVIANQVAIAVERMSARAEVEEGSDLAHASDAPPPPSVHRHVFWYFKNDDCVFVDGEYLIRNVPGKILWKILTGYQQEKRSEFSNRELRLDQSLGLPPIKDNLESRLILLRRRLEEKCPDVKLVPTKRGRFAIEVGCTIELVEKQGTG